MKIPGMELDKPGIFIYIQHACNAVAIEIICLESQFLGIYLA
jgi:hypothetical protein